MDKEKFEKLKEEEKEHLRKIKELKGQLRNAQRQKGIADAFSGVTGAAGSLDSLDEMTEKLQMDAATSEAKFEMALDSADEQIKAAATEEPVIDEEAARKERAKALVEQMKMAMGGASAATAATAAEASVDSDVEKTIGRPMEEDGQEPELEKTIGRAIPEQEEAEPAAEASIEPSAEVSEEGDQEDEPEKTIGRSLDGDEEE